MKPTELISDIEVEARFARQTIGTNSYGFKSQKHDNELWSVAVSYKCRDQHVVGKKRYELTNHLGNVLTVISDKRIAVDEHGYTVSSSGNYSEAPGVQNFFHAFVQGTAYAQNSTPDGFADHYIAEIISSTEYSAYGVPLNDWGYQSEGYRYGFQNQEQDEELWEGAVSFKYRIEDPRLGRFLSIDPLIAKYPYNSPYAFSENRVLDAIELEGLEKVIIIGGADILSQGESTETMLTLANNIKEFGSKHGLISLEVKTFVQSANDPMSKASDIVSYLKVSVDPSEPLIIYGYSMGGANAIKIVNWMAENLPEYQVDLLVTVDPAVVGESVQYVKDNVDEVWNYFQSDRNYLGSQGFVIFPEEGNDKTYVDNINYDREKSKNGLGAHGKMDEDTLEEAGTLICNELIED